MPYRSSKASRAKDQQIHENLLAGYTPELVAKQFNLQSEQVLAADRRVRERRAKKGPDEARLEDLEIELRVLRRETMREFRRSADESEETTKISADDTNSKRKVERMFRKSRGSAQLARVVLSTIREQRQLTNLQRESGQDEVREAAMQEARDNAKERMRLLNEHPDLYFAFVRAKDALAEAQQRGPHPVPGR